jgi:hypothetical protein
MNWYKLAQHKFIDPKDSNMEYIEIGHNGHYNSDRLMKNPDYIWWSNDGQDIKTVEVNIENQNLIHDDIPQIKDNVWKGRFDGTTKLLSVGTPSRLREYIGIPNRLLHNLKSKFNPLDIKVFIVGNRTYIGKENNELV